MKTETNSIKPDAIYELKEAAAALGVSPSTIHRWTHRGLIICRYRRINKRRVWSGRELIKAWKLSH